MSDRPEPLARHWSQLAPGDVVRATKSIWMRIATVEPRDEGWLLVVGEDLCGRRRGEVVTRWLGKGQGQLYLVRPTEDEEVDRPQLSWTMPQPGLWASSGYEIKRQPSARAWRILRDGVHWDTVPRLPLAKRLCERDHARRRRDAELAGASS